jgi:hypothetical protein
MQDSTLMGCELDGVPGFVPRLLRDPGIGLFRSDERVFEAMLHGWRAQMLAAGWCRRRSRRGARWCRASRLHWRVPVELAAQGNQATGLTTAKQGAGAATPLDADRSRTHRAAAGSLW